MKSLQLRGRRQIAEPRKYYLVRVIVFFLRVFSLFVLFLTGWNFGLNSLHSENYINKQTFQKRAAKQTKP